MLNDDEVVTSVQAESEPVDEDNNNESRKGQSNVGTFFFVRDSYGVVRTTIRVMSQSTTASQENQRPWSKKTKVHNDTAKNK
ncbi:hypothetical protein TNCV_1929921 [Trichonephila clavipes]|nr:hypothetical protein TNCV_1929921 [Trichonephila clavipes]